MCNQMVNRPDGRATGREITQTQGLARTPVTSDRTALARYSAVIRADYPDLARVVERWPGLSEAMKMHVMAIVQPAPDVRRQEDHHG